MLSPSHQLSLKPVTSWPLTSSGRYRSYEADLRALPELVALGQVRRTAQTRPTTAWWRSGTPELIGFDPPPNGMFPAIRISCFNRAVRRIPPGHAGRQRHPDIILAQRVAAVVDPVVYLELDPRRGEQVQRPGRAERVAVQELLADRDRAGHVEQVRPQIRPQVTAERRSHRAHLGRGQVVAGPVERPPDPDVLAGRDGGTGPGLRRGLTDLAVEQVPAAQFVAERLEVEQSEADREPVPRQVPVDGPEHRPAAPPLTTFRAGVSVCHR